MHLTGSGMDLKLLGHVTWKLSKQHNLISIQVTCINAYKSITQQQPIFIMWGTFLRILSLNSQFCFPPINSKIKVKFGWVIGRCICRSQLTVLFQSVSPVHKRDTSWTWVMNFKLFDACVNISLDGRAKGKVTGVYIYKRSHWRHVQHCCLHASIHSWNFSSMNSTVYKLQTQHATPTQQCPEYIANSFSLPVRKRHSNFCQIYMSSVLCTQKLKLVFQVLRCCTKTGDHFVCLLTFRCLQ